MHEPEPVLGYEWFLARDLRGSRGLTPPQIRRLYMLDRPRDQVIDRERWVAVPVGYGIEQPSQCTEPVYSGPSAPQRCALPEGHEGECEA